MRQQSPKENATNLRQISKANPTPNPTVTGLDRPAPTSHPLWSGATIVAALDNAGEVPAPETVERLLPVIEALTKQTGTEDNERVTALAWEAFRNRCIEMAALHIHDPEIVKTYFGLAERSDIALGRSLSRLDVHMKNRPVPKAPIGDRIAKNEFEREQFRQLRARGFNV
ncbi:hypothetical protein [Leptolyngbya sp. AN10]|uniref:hypothetical protein n=1 Tax=Leptolyngbya sp. AN10 TaxID=3423365 RepID=UPI003D30F971